MEDDGTIYVSDSNNLCIRRIRAVGTGVAMVDTISTLSGPGVFGGGGNGVQGPAGLALQPASGTLVVADPVNNRILGASTRGGSFTVRALAGGAFHGTERLYSPYAVAAHAHGCVLVADTGNGCIRLLSPTPPAAAEAAPEQMLPAAASPFAPHVGAQRQLFQPRDAELSARAQTPQQALLAPSTLGHRDLRRQTPC